MITKRSKILYLLLLLLINGCVFASNSLQARINALLTQSSQKNVVFGIKIIKADSGELVYSHYGQNAMVPASNMKIVTTAAAVSILGADFEYVTRIGLSGGDLVVIGSGDPLLGDEKTDAKYGRDKGWIFADIGEKLQKAQISSINDIIIDSGVFDDERVHPNWPAEQLNRWYACEVCGVNYNDNCVAMTVKRSGSTIKIFTEPSTGFLDITNKVRVINSGSGAVGAYRTTGKPNHLVVKGKCRKQQGPFDVAIERPAAFFGFLLYEQLTRNGISVKGKLIEKSVGGIGDVEFIAEYKTALSDCLKRANKDSLGLVAESLLKTIAYYQNPEKKGGSWQAGRKRISKFLEGLGVSREQFYIDDGSGLSRENRLSTESICTVLADIYKGKNWAEYKDSLAVGGVDGTIRRYFGQPQYKGRVFGKTGYISGVKSFSGFCNTPNGNYIFSIISNKANNSTRYVINDIVKALFK